MNTSSNIVVLGGGESGIGAALLAQQQGARVFVSDYGSIGEQQRAELEAAGIEYEQGQHSWERLSIAHEVIKSPGIPDTVAIVRKLVDAGVPVIGEIEYASRFTEATLVAITGSNGKTTTAYLTHHLLTAAGKRTALVGNVGYSFARHLAQDPPAEVYVIEVSSFQLDSIRKFRPHLASILNITPDHLDRYNYELDGYIDSKLRITRNQLADDQLWVLAEDQNIALGLSRNPLRAKVNAISKASVLIGKIQLTSGEELDLTATELRGKHNALNALFAAGIAGALGADAASLQAGLNSFKPVPHRLEPVGEIAGVRYINDSKATNVDAVTYALDAIEQPIVWIAGGTDKGNDYTSLQNLVRQKVVALVCMGADNTKLRTAFARTVAVIEETQSAEAAVATAARLAQAGQVVLLSPACASFDLFKNYIDRGDQFRAAVQNLKA